MFPDARFIHIYRNGLEVARSIAKFSEKYDWFGKDSYKWSKLLEYAMNSDEYKLLPEIATSNFDKGLLEWRLSTEAAVNFLGSLPEDKFFEFNYDELIDHPIESISWVLEFIDIEEDDNVKNFVFTKLIRQTNSMSQYEVSAKEKTLWGKLIPLSMASGEGLTRCSA